MSLTPDPSSADLPEEEHSSGEASEATSPQQATEAIPPEETAGAATPTIKMPVEAEYETNGGPLGCCLGTVVGVLLTALLITFLTSFSSRAIFGPATLPIVLIGAALFGYLGWRIGRSVYREYELSPRQKRKLAHLEKKYGPERARR